MTETLNIIPLIQQLVLIITVAVGGAIVGYFKTIRSTQRKYEQLLDDLCKRTWRISKALVILAKLVDEKTKSQNPEIKSDLDELVKEILDEDPRTN